MFDRENRQPHATALRESSAVRLRATLGLGAGEAVRLLYLPGPGDVQGTFAHWLEGRDDPGLMNLAYSRMFYDVVEAVEAEALVACLDPVRHPGSDALRFVQLRRRAGRGAVGYFAGEAAYAREARQVIRSFAPHVVVAGGDFPQELLAYATRGVPRTILSVHNAYGDGVLRGRGPKRRLRRRALLLGLRRIDAAVTVSDLCRAQVEALTGGMVPVSTFVPQTVTRPPWRERVAARRFLFAGRIVPEKGVFDLLDAFAAASDGRDDLTLAICGDGGALDAARERARAAGMRGVELLGKLERDALSSEYDRCDVVVCPTRPEFFEGLAKPPLEGALTGAPSIVSDVVPARELLGRAALSYPAGDVPALAASLRSLVDDPARMRRMSRATRAACAVQVDPSLSWGARVLEAMLAIAPRG